LAFGHWLLAVGYWLLAVGYRLKIIYPSGDSVFGGIFFVAVLCMFFTYFYIHEKLSNRINMKKLLFFIVIIIASSCGKLSSLKTSKKKLNRQAEVGSTDAVLLQKPILAELDISPKRDTMTYNTTSADMSEALSISSKRKNRNDLLISSKEMLLREAQNRAEFAFMEEFHCDFLVDPIYKFDLEEISNSDVIVINVRVSAYAAKYKKFTQPDSLPKSVIAMNQISDRGIPLYTNSTILKTDYIKKWTLNAGPNFSSVLGDAAKVTPFAFGGDLILNGSISKKTDFSAAWGLTSFLNDKKTPEDYKLSSKPLRIGLKIHFQDRDKGGYIFGHAAFDKYKSSPEEEYSRYNGFSAGWGYQFNETFDLSINYSAFDNDFKFWGVRIGYRIIDSEK